MAITKSKAKTANAARKKRTAPAKKKSGRKEGTKYPRGGKGVVKGSGAAARRKIRGKLKSSGLIAAEGADIESRYVALGMTVDRVGKLQGLGLASTADATSMIQADKAMRRMLADLDKPPPPPPKTLDASDRVRFAEAHLTVADGGRFGIKGREWQRDQFWRPLDGFRLWPVEPLSACAACSKRAGEIVDTVYAADRTRTKSHAAKTHGCRGLYVHVIWLVLIQLKRQQGKTTGVAGYVISGLLRHSRESMAFIAGSEDQSEKLFRRNFGRPVTTSPELSGSIKVMRTRLICDRTGSEFELFPTSLAGATGGTHTLVIADEARDVPAEIFAAMVPTVYARNGWRCPTGLPSHAWSSGDLDLLETGGAAVDPRQERYGKKCTACGTKIEPWTGRVVAMSSAQELGGGDGDWFHDLCETLEAEPQPDTHVFRTSRIVNPKVSRQIVARTEGVLGKVRGLSDSIAIEAGGVSRRKGEPFLTGSQVLRIEDPSLVSQPSGIRPAVAFLDTSDVTDLTSLVIMEDASLPGEKTWCRIVQAHITVWRPADMDGGYVDDTIVYPFLIETLPRFALLEFRVDDRLRPWATSLITRMRTDAPFKRIIRGCDRKGEKWGPVERRLGWSKLDERVEAMTMRLIRHPDQHAELKAARRFYDADGRLDVREQSRKRRHLDIIEGVASCCLMIHTLANAPTGQSLAKIEGRAAATAAILRRAGRRSIAPKLGTSWE